MMHDITTILIRVISTYNHHDYAFGRYILAEKELEFRSRRYEKAAKCARKAGEIGGLLDYSMI
jgi:hypothetical protein